VEPFFRATTPDGRISVEVLVPEGSEGAEAVLFKCSVKVDERDVIEELETLEQNKMLQWVRRQMVEAMRRSTPAVEGETNGLDSD
jgi:hypothetical protein